MQISKSALTLAVLISISIVVTAYTANAYYVASFIYENNGRLWWPNTLGGTFTPWPYRPTGFASTVLTELDQEDYLYYNYVIKSGVLIILTLLLWIIVGWRIWNMRHS